MKRTIVTALAIISACAGSASAESLEGSFSVGGSLANINGSKAKFNEYRTVGNGMESSLDLTYRDQEQFLDLSAILGMSNEKTANQSAGTNNELLLKAGKTNDYKLEGFYKEIPHNLTFGATTYLNGVGTATLTKPTANANPTLANYTNSFDYGYLRRNYGAEAEVSFKSPYFVNVRVDRTEVNGLTPFTVGTSLREVPAPINNATSNLTMQAGYRSDKLIATVEATASKFQNDFYKFSTWNSTTSPTYFGYEPADNDAYRVGASATYKLPNINSILMVKASRSLMQSDATLYDNGTTGSFTTPLDWKGRITYTTANASLSTKANDALSTKMFVNYLNKSNNSPEGLTYGTTSYTTDAFDYSKRNAGLEANYKLNAQNTLSAGYEYLGMKRSVREDAPKTDDHTVFVQAKNSSFDWLTSKIRYQYLTRSSDNELGALHANDATSATVTSSSLYFAQFTQPADVANKKQHGVKAGFDFDLAHNWTLGVEYAFKYDDFTKNYLGMLNAKRNELYLDTTYTKGIAKFTAYGDLEVVNSFARYRQIARTASTSAPQYFDPFGTNDVNNFNWTTNRKDLNYAVGVTSDLEIIKGKLNSSIGYRYEKANGSNDFNTNVAPSVAPTNVTALDDYKKHAVNAKLTYALSKTASLDLGCLYENLKYVDDAYSNYTNIVGTNYLSGAYANQSYNASVVYTKLNYKF